MSEEPNPGLGRVQGAGEGGGVPPSGSPEMVGALQRTPEPAASGTAPECLCHRPPPKP